MSDISYRKLIDELAGNYIDTLEKDNDPTIIGRVRYENLTGIIRRVKGSTNATLRCVTIKEVPEAYAEFDQNSMCRANWGDDMKCPCFLGHIKYWLGTVHEYEQNARRLPEKDGELS